ncbi:hypothetical protein Npun_F1318 [Nostoc punctiforme PCC 73102]|uniref:Uncharacterized protein n=1 Tax=Nostoc punctiforme (strain ATCC 29133 / PCC 73102) TaxID=63737 RepID=B2IYE7_NOSP7|nr:hypothetical protein Npun_F1318 [Nostoc punctiforme PCC 73102]
MQFSSSISLSFSFLFQSLIGILRNCNKGYTPGLPQFIQVSIPNRDFEKLQSALPNDWIGKKMDVSIPNRDFEKLQSGINCHSDRSPISFNP